MKTARKSDAPQNSRRLPSVEGGLSMSPPPFQLFSSADSSLPRSMGDVDSRGGLAGLEMDERLGQLLAEGDTRTPEQIAGADPGTEGSGCSASATGVSLGPSTDFNDGHQYGLITPIKVRGKKLAKVEDSELVGTSMNHLGSMTHRPSARSTNSEFMPANNIPDDRHMSGIEDHLSFYDNHGGDGSYDRLQMDLFKIPKCGITTPQSMPNSGYRLKRHIFREGNNIVGQITKTAEAVSIDGFSSTAGLTPQRQTAKLVLRTLP